MVGGGKIADYLEKGDDASAVLAGLMAEPQGEKTRSVPQAASEAKKEEEAVSEKLETLTSDAPAAQPAPAVPEKPAEDLSAANAKLDDLLGKNK